MYSISESWMTKTDELKTALATKGLKYVGHRGTPGAPICFIGEAPGADEDQSGVPFVGSSGRELDRMLSETGIQGDNCWWTNPYKTRPPENKLDRLHELGVDKQLFIDQFFEELNVYKPCFIAPLGATPLGILCPFTLSKRTGNAEISKWRGSILQSEFITWPHIILPNFHPAFLFRAWEERAVALLIFGKLKEEFDYWRANDRLQPLPSRELISDPPADTAIDFLRSLLATPERPISADIENIGVYRGKYKTPERNRVPYVIGFANSPNCGISIGLAEYDKPKIQELWRLIDRLLATCTQVGQNYYSHDAPWLDYIGFGVNVSKLHDTRIRHHVLWPELSHKLDFQTMQYTREPYYKDEGKQWTVKDRQKMKKYNIKDVCVTLEIYNEQEKEFAQRPSLRDFYNNYEMPLARAFFSINSRGMLVDTQALGVLRQHIDGELASACGRISAQLSGRAVVAQAEKSKAKAKSKKVSVSGSQVGGVAGTTRTSPLNAIPSGSNGLNVLNLSAPKQVGDVLKSLGMKLPSKNRGNGKWSESTDEESLQELFAQNGHPLLKEILRVRALNHTLTNDVNARLTDDNILLGCFETAGTVTGRRSCGDNFLGLGTNLQNRPKHTDLAKRLRECYVARPGKIFVACDQISAEDWIVQGIIADQSGDRRGLDELLSGVDRHAKLASFIFSKPLAACGKDTPDRFMGKKTRHAGNYDMEAFRFACEMVKEGHHVKQDFCQFLLDRFHQADPGIKGVFHEFVKRELTTKRTLTNLFGRERQFFSLRDYADNKKIFKEGYAQIPQGTIGDNTGLAILYLETHHPGYVLLDVHDAVYLETADNIAAISTAMSWLATAFDRVIRFPKGLEIKIPIEFEIGYDLGHMKSCDVSDLVGLQTIYNGLSRRQKVHEAIIFGARPVSSQQPVNVTSG